MARRFDKGVSLSPARLQTRYNVVAVMLFQLLHGWAHDTSAHRTNSEHLIVSFVCTTDGAACVRKHM
jgi:hypothetical protein